LSKRIAGVLILFMWLADLAHLYLQVSIWPAAVLAWAAALLLGPGLDPAARRQCSVLYLCALLLLALAWSQGARLEASALLLPNVDMVTLFAAVSCLNLATGSLAQNKGTWSGWKGVWGTLLGVNLLGAVINMSVLFVVGDRLARQGRLERRQVIMLSRIYCSAAFWSPFFIAMAVAVTYAPGMIFTHILPFGLLGTVAAMLITLLEVRQLGIENFEGYPLRVQTLLLPGLLALTVIVGRLLWPELSIVGIISLAAPLISLLLMPKQRVTLALRRQVTERFPAMGSQVVLFLGAGLLAAAINGLTQVWSPAPLLAAFHEFGVLEATLTVTLILAIAYLGVHPIITISSLSPLLWHLHPDPTLLGMTFLLGWGLSTGATPLSGANLALLACYRVRARDLLLWNLGYAGKMLLVCAGLFALYRQLA
jgi:hypothetical protein